jgi:hypothetical protein
MRLRTMVSTALTVLLTATALAMPPSQAATISVERDGCNPAGCYAIYINGKIEFDDFKTFHALIEQNQIKVAVVALNSRGGNLLAGLFIGLDIHDYEFATYVGDDTFCASVCASIWLAGKMRYVSSTSHIGFHQPYIKDRRGRLIAQPDGVALFKQYYARIGIPKPAADFMVSANPSDVYWLNTDLAKGFDIEIVQLKAPDKPKTADRATVTLPKALVDRMFEDDFSLTAKMIQRKM